MRSVLDATFDLSVDASSARADRRGRAASAPGRQGRGPLRQRGAALRHEADPAALATPDPTIMRLWREYKTCGAAAARDRLIIHYMTGHVRRLARRLHAMLPRQVDLEDLVQQGYQGLVDSIERFDIERDVRFETFSSRRIFGEMRDYLRKIDVMPRLARARAKVYQAAMDQFIKEFGRAPSMDELRRRVDLPEKQFRRLLADGRPPLMVSFNGSGGAAGMAAGAGSAAEEADAMGSFPDRRALSPLSQAERDDLKRWISQGFSRRDRLILILYYFEQMTMKEVGRTLGCSESRVSQRLESVLARLRARLACSGAECEFE